MLSVFAQKLLTWLNKYSFTPGSYNYYLTYYPVAERRGVFGDAFNELLGVYGYY